MFAQDLEARIETFNEITGVEYLVSNKKKTLVIQGFREGEQVKVDKVNVFDLDIETLSFSETDNAISIKCYSDLDGCVERTLTRERNKKSYRNRIVFGLTENMSGLEVLEALKLVLQEMAKKY